MQVYQSTLKIQPEFKTGISCNTCRTSINYESLSHYYQFKHYYYCYQCSNLNCQNYRKYSNWTETSAEVFKNVFPLLFQIICPIENRLIKFKRMAKYGCSNISFYDFIRVYKERYLLSFPEIEIPYEYIVSKITSPNCYNDINFSSIAKNLPYYLFMHNDVLFSCLIHYIHPLSKNPSIPIKFIISSSKFINWDFNSISRYNLTFTYNTLIELNDFHPLNIDELSNNPSILIEWIIKLPTWEWNWSFISERLTYSQIKWIYNHLEYREKLNWTAISNNDQITAEDILENLKEKEVFPWEFRTFKNPTIEYYHEFRPDSRNLIQSNRIDLNDLIQEGIPVSSDWRFNQNINLNDIETYNLHHMFLQNDYHLVHQRANQKHPIYYKLLLKNVLKELTLY